MLLKRRELVRIFIMKKMRFEAIIKKLKIKLYLVKFESIMNWIPWA